MIKKIHVKSPMFLPTPYIVRVEHGIPGAYNFDLAEFYKLLRRTRTTIFATWGYTDPELEVAPSREAGQDAQARNSSMLSITDTIFLLRSYWIFEDKSDALQFRLGLPELATQVFMWPRQKVFTIYEYA